jgi:hypothetical protein
LVRDLGYIPAPKEITLLIGGDPSNWGRILKGQQKISGEYHARLKRVKDVGLENARLELIAAAKNQKYGERTRKGRIVPHAKNVFKDMYSFNLEKMTQGIINERLLKGRYCQDEYDQYIWYMEIGQELEMHGYQYPRDDFEEQKLRKEFIESLS